MNPRYLALLVASATLPLTLYSQTTAYEGFSVPSDYADEEDVHTGSGGTGWAGDWTVNSGAGAFDVEQDGGGLSYGELDTADGRLEFDGAAFDRASRLFSASNIGTDTFYFSFLWQDGAITNVNDSFAITESNFFERYRVQSNGAGEFVLWVNMVGGGAGILTSAGTTSGLDETQPILIVVELKIGQATDSFTAYFNPSDLSNVAGTAAQTLSATEAAASALYGGSFQNNIAGVRFNSTADTNNKWDEIRVAYNGATIADVAPFTPTIDPEQVVYDGIDNAFYTPDASLHDTSGGSNWASAWRAGDSNQAAFLSKPNGLCYLDLATTDGAIQKNGENVFGQLSRQFREDGSFSGTIYASILVQAAAHNESDRYLVLDETLASGQERFRITNDGSGQLKVEVKLSGGSGSHELLGTTTSLSLTNPTLIVVELTLGGSNDTLNVYFNPSDLSDIPGSAAETITGSESDFSGSFSTGIAYVGVKSVGSSTGNLNQYDELRIAYGTTTSLSDVVPVVAADPLVYEGFHVPVDYLVEEPDLAPLGVSIDAGAGGNNWEANWSDRDGDDYLAKNGGLRYLNLDTTHGQLEKVATNNGGSLSRQFRAAGGYSGTIYFSELVQLADNHPSDTVFILDQDGFTQSRFRVRNDGSGQYVVEAKLIGGTGSHEILGTTSGLDLSEPVLIVGELVLGTATDTFTVYFNPTDLSDVSGTAAQTISRSETEFTGTFATDINKCGITSIARTHVYDELRLSYGLGASLADVLPTFDRFNVLFITIDDLRPQLFTYGETQMVTPELDTLASSSLQFNRAFVQQSICAPSRDNLMTGLRPDTTRVYNISTDFRDFVPWVTTMPQFFRNQGYHVTSRGKVFHGGTEDNGLSWDPQDPAYGGNTNSLNEYLLPANIAIQQSNGRGPAFENPGTVEDTDYVDGRTARTAARKFADLKKRQPFFYAVGLNRPHLPFTAPGQYWDLYSSGVIDAAIPTDFTPAANTGEYTYRDSGEMRVYSGVPAAGTPISSDATLIRNLVHGYYASVSYADALVGTVLDGLRAEGLDDNTIVVVWGDHGYHLGNQEVWAKASNFDRTTRVPLFVKVPGVTDLISYSGTTEAIVETVDIYPTLVELCGFSPPDWVEGESFADVVEDPATLGRTSALSQFPRFTTESEGYSANVMGYSLRTDDNYRYTEWRLQDSDFVVAQELYDIDNDPEEDTSIHLEPANAALLANLAVELQNRLDEYKPSLKGNAVLAADNSGFNLTSDILSQTVGADASKFYTLRFEASATSDRIITFEWTNSGGGTTYFEEDFQLRTTSTNYELNAFIPQSLVGTDASALARFLLGANSNQVTISNIELLEQTSLVREVFASGDDWSSGWQSIDEDGDGLSRFIEYSANLSFTVPDNQFLNPGSGSAGLPVAYFSSPGSGGRVAVEFIRRRGASDIDYIVEFGSDLSLADPWTRALNSQEASVTPINSDYERVVYEDTETPASADQRFGRMRILYNP